jgi:hypothetical protein
VQSGLPCRRVKRSAQRFAINRDNLPLGRALEFLGPASEALGKCVRVQRRKHFAKGVVARYSNSNSNPSRSRNQSSLASPNLAISTKVVAPAKVAHSAITSISIKEYRCALLCARGSGISAKWAVMEMVMTSLISSLAIFMHPCHPPPRF